MKGWLIKEKVTKSYLSGQRCDRYLSDSIYAQPTNTVIQNRDIDDIVKDGGRLLRGEKFMLGGKKIDV